jgi:hypothetical protein
MVGKVVHIHPIGQAQLFNVIDASNVLRPGLSFGERRQKHGRQYGDDGNDHQQFNQGKCLPAACVEGESSSIHVFYGIDLQVTSNAAKCPSPIYVRLHFPGMKPSPKQTGKRGLFERGRCWAATRNNGAGFCTDNKNAGRMARRCGENIP